jgi:hypothetical protein
VSAQLAGVRFKDSEDTPVEGLEQIGATKGDETKSILYSSAAAFMIKAR